MFQLKTIAALAGRVAGQEAGESLIQAVEPFALISEHDRAALPAGVVDAYPLSQVQTGMLVEMLASGDEHVYQNINSFRIPDTEPFAAPAMGRALSAVMTRHDILRTSMHLDGYSQPLQLVHAEIDVPLAVHDLRGLTPEQRTEKIRAYVDEQKAVGTELKHAPLLRIAVHIESDDAWRLTVGYQHAVADGWSLNSLLMELLGLYRELRDGREPAAYEVPSVRYADFIAAEQASLTDPVDQAFWQGVVEGHSPVQLPAAWAEADGSGEALNRRVPFADLEEDLRRLAVEEKTSLKSVLLAAHLKVLGSLTPEESFHTGVVYHGRLEAPGADRVLGMHLNTLPFPAVKGARTWRELVGQVYAQETEIWSHRRYPLPAIQRAADSTDGFLPALFEYLDFHQVDRDTVDVSSTLGDGANQFGLTALASGGSVNLIAAADVVTEEALERLAGMYRSVLESMAADADGSALA
ncbi:condensation domain-containing protein, partial [Streptomyces sp. NPDC040724]|uniref:condensation domain-containing protein n=1 Tax=Streptomyces sp. NPDC040724 TaxID=3155612 RepID=UPI0033ED57CB